ncbi:putative protease HtpX [Anaerohalosphaera lusitana]|uniref:Protease HtpX homolog n=1 Tax=Anaerohalosphaera lusitana TaxID=1936003 RepID=A0A1U9NN59_9BACT|nr:M48 family metallopeptidase [Anaerohalosphaera lusitana]AQT69333.1 putative protease HtpX [Anaerohalosphaera lusitana]
MWEQIRANKRNSIILLGTMAVVLMGLGYVIGMLLAGPKGGYYGVAAASGLWVVLTIVSFSSGDQILLSASKAKPVTPEVHPQLWNVVEEMTIAASLPKMPKVYIIPDPAPNAFATGRSPKSASVAVTAGLLGKLNRDELQGVVAHEVSHILHRDILFVTLAGIMLGTIVILSQLLLRSTFYGAFAGGRRYSSRSNGNAQGQLLMIVIAILAAILAPVFANILYFALSRRREYLADAGAARLTRYPAGLASALEKISSNAQPVEAVNKVTASMYISNPLSAKKRGSLFSTHPPIEERVKILRTMSRGASFKDYSDAYSQTVGSGDGMPASLREDKEQVGLREASEAVGAAAGMGGAAGAATAAAARSAEEEPAKTAKEQHRQIGDLIRIANGFAILTCGCGLKMKIPPNYNRQAVKCPRCGRKSALKK